MYWSLRSDPEARFAPDMSVVAIIRAGLSGGRVVSSASLISGISSISPGQLVRLVRTDAAFQTSDSDLNPQAGRRLQMLAKYNPPHI